MARGLLPWATVITPVSPPRSLPRWSRAAVVAAIGLMGAALVAMLWTTQRNVRDARTTMLKGQAAEANGVLRSRMMDRDDGTMEQRLREAFDAAAGYHLTYVAALDREHAVIAEAGRTSLARPALDAWIAAAKPGELVQVGQRIRVVYKRVPRPGRVDEPPPPPRNRPAGYLLELDTSRVDELDTTSTWSLVIGIAAAATLIVLTAILVRWSLRREDAVRAVEQARHLASLGQMSAVLAHEIRNPLASLKGNAQLLALSLPDGERRCGSST